MLDWLLSHSWRNLDCFLASPPDIFLPTLTGHPLLAHLDPRNNGWVTSRWHGSRGVRTTNKHHYNSSNTSPKLHSGDASINPGWTVLPWRPTVHYSQTERQKVRIIIHQPTNTGPGDLRDADIHHLQMARQRWERSLEIQYDILSLFIASSDENTAVTLRVLAAIAEAVQEGLVVSKRWAAHITCILYHDLITNFRIETYTTVTPPALAPREPSIPSLMTWPTQWGWIVLHYMWFVVLSSAHF